MSELKIFENAQFGSARFVFEDDTFYVVGKDLLRALGYAEGYDVNKAFASVPEEWAKRYLIPFRSSNGVVQEREALCLSEQGLYFFLGRSDKPAALPYQKWVAGEVVPSIRKIGSYSEIEKAAQPKSYSLADQILARKTILELCYDGNQLALALDKTLVKLTGCSALQEAEAQLIAPQQKQLYTPTQIGQNVNPVISAVKVNKILESIGWQVKIDNKWEKCGAGEAHGVYLDTGKAHSDGTPIRQLKWESDTIFAVQSYLNDNPDF